MTTSTSYTLAITTDMSYDDAVAAARTALADEGFGVLTEIDVKSVLKAKLDIDQEPYIILGACNPTLAHQALTAEPELGALLPCNVIVYVLDGTTHVSAVDAERMLSLVAREDVAPIAAEVNSRLQRVMDAVAAAS